MAKKLIIGSLIAVSISLGFYRVCMLEALNSVEDYFKYRIMPVEEFRMKLNRQDGAAIYDLKKRLKPGDGVLVLDSEQYFVAYYAYPIRLYKFNKGYYRTSKKHTLGDVDRKWMEDRNIKWVFK